MSGSRLYSLSPSLARQFGRAEASLRRAVVAMACDLSVAASGLKGAEVDEALASLKDAQNVASDLSVSLETIAARLDERYLDAWETASDEESQRVALALFAKARAASALGIALGNDDRLLDEAIYEAALALEEPSAFVADAQRLLS